MLKRSLLTELAQWKYATNRKPLLIRGARQVGKSYLVNMLGQEYFDNLVTINFEIAPEYKTCFHTLKPHEICDGLRLMSKQAITPGKTLLFLDEIQDCPKAIQALRYFKEDMPELHVIGAGSLLELSLKKATFRMPVGRIESLFLYPLSFQEFLMATQPHTEILQQLKQVSIKKPLSPAVHEYLLRELRTYLFLGGLPEVIAHYSASREHEITHNSQNIQKIQASIIDTYKQDFGHYSQYAKLTLLDSCFTQVPLMIGQQIKYNKIDAEQRSRDLKQALATLESASIVTRIQATSGKGLPLDAGINEKKFKLNFLDVGLVKRANQLDIGLLQQEDVMLLNQGALAEQFVGQELLAHSPYFEKPKLYFWARDGFGTAEVDYLKVIGKDILPIEVKSGKAGKMRSLKQYLLEHKAPFGIRLSLQELSYEQNILSVPLYLIAELDRLVLELNNNI